MKWFSAIVCGLLSMISLGASIAYSFRGSEQGPGFGYGFLALAFAAAVIGHCVDWAKL